MHGHGPPSGARSPTANGARRDVRHLIAVEDEVWRSRLASVVDEDDPHWSWTEPGLAPGLDDAPLEEILAAFAAARAAFGRHHPGLDDAGWARSGTHATYGRLDVAGLLRIATDHADAVGATESWRRRMRATLTESRVQR